VPKLSRQSLYLSVLDYAQRGWNVCSNKTAKYARGRETAIARAKGALNVALKMPLLVYIAGTRLANVQHAREQAKHNSVIATIVPNLASRQIRNFFYLIQKSLTSTNRSDIVNSIVGRVNLVLKS